MSTHNICLHGKIRKIQCIFMIPHLARAVCMVLCKRANLGNRTQISPVRDEE